MRLSLKTKIALRQKLRAHTVATTFRGVKTSPRSKVEYFSESLMVQQRVFTPVRGLRSHYDVWAEASLKFSGPMILKSYYTKLGGCGVDISKFDQRTEAAH